MRVTCFYHDDCVDGFAAMWAVKQKYPEAECHPVDYNRPPPFYPEGYLIIVDFTFNDFATMKALIEKATYTLHIDHHQGAKDLVTRLKEAYYGTGNYYAVFDENRSGAGITWDYLHRDDRPEFISLVEDRDLWRFRFTNTEDFGVVIRNAGFALTVYDYAATSEGLQDFILRGKEENAIKMTRVTANIERTQKLTTLSAPVEVSEQHAVIAVASQTQDRHDASEQCHQMLSHNDEEYAVCWWYHEGGMRFRISSRQNGPNVIPIAKHYGGGGHPHASGFHLPLDHPLAISMMDGLLI